MTFRDDFTRSAWLMVLLLGLAHPAFAQLTLDAFSPADGATDVTTTATVEFTFSAAVDTMASFEVSGGFFLGVEVFPDPGDPLDVRVSGDGGTVSIDLQLEEDTKYQVLLTGALSTTGQPLDRPYEFTFSTGSTLPAGSVSGTISFPGGDPTGTLVGLFTDEGSFLEGDAEAAAVVPDASGAYTANFVSEGAYFVAAFKDLDQNGSAGDPYEDALGLYDADGDQVVDLLSVGEGDNVAGIDVSIGVPDMVTARAPFPSALLLARLAAADARLGFTLAEVTPEGEAPFWSYLFFSPAQTDTIGIVAIGDQFAFGGGFFGGDDGEDDDDGPPLDLSVPLPEDWIDSDVAVDSAEARGGADFRAANPDVQIVAFLSNLPEGLCTFFGKRDRASGLFAGERSPVALAAKVRQLAGKAAATAQTKAYWLVLYFLENADDPSFGVCVDAVTGEPPPPPVPTTARPNLEAADAAARAWAADVQLKLVQVAPGNSISATGEAPGWWFIYFSPSMDRARLFFMIGGSVSSEGDLGAVIRSLDPLPEGWIDSSVAANAAEAGSGDFRNRHADAFVTAQLSRQQLDAHPDTTVWRFKYVSQQDADSLTVFVDALTGTVITAIEEEPGLPSTFVLEQNYPNPFNPSTRIPFGLARAGHVALAVYNLLGQRVATLVDQFLPAGSYSFAWQPNALPSGLYLYQLKTGDVVLHRTMTLRK